jgi:tetratricopeptide (TPR) repeat protein
MLATMLYLGGRLDQAMPVFKRTLEVDLGLFSSHVQLARIYEAAGLPDSALQERRLALDASPDDPGLLLDLGAACLKTGRFSEAATLLGQAAGLNPRDARVPYLQGIVALRLSQTDEARKAFERFLAIAPRRFAAQMDEVRSQLASLNSPAPPGQ